MTKLYLTTVFHGNLGYSSINKSRYKEVIDKCYWPCLSIVENIGIKLGFEFPAKTLEIINKLDPSFIIKLKELWENNKIEFIGSGYVQSIFPLIPVSINQKNLEMGNNVYKKLLGKIPKIAFVNEHIYSKGLIKVYKKAGYETIIIDWVNAVQSNKKIRESKFMSSKIVESDDSINVVWNNSIAFQKLQRYVYGDVSTDEYVDFVKSYYSNDEDRVFMLYGNDMEIFDFRARNPETLHSGGVKSPEIQKIQEVFKILNNFHNIQFIFPSESLDLNFNNKGYSVCSYNYPIIAKKQAKYNVVRWAVCGKNNYINNALCYKAYNSLNSEKDMEKLVELWASDFRTHTEEEKFKIFRSEISKLIKDVKIEDKSWTEIDIPDNTIDTNKILLKLSSVKGGTIKELTFKEISKKPLIVTIPPEYYDDAKYSVDLFSGHSIVFSNGKQKTDLRNIDIKFYENTKRIKAVCINKIDEDFRITKSYFVDKNNGVVELEIEFDLDDKIKPYFLRAGIITFNPEAFDKDSLYYSCLNGGYEEERYKIDNYIDHLNPIELRISAQNCLGSTDGKFEVGDNNIKLKIETDKSEMYSVPMIKFEKINNSYILRVYNSIIEKDETSNCYLIGKNKIRFVYTAEKFNE